MPLNNPSNTKPNHQLLDLADTLLVLEHQLFGTVLSSSSSSIQLNNGLDVNVIINILSDNPICFGFQVEAASGFSSFDILAFKLSLLDRIYLQLASDSTKISRQQFQMGQSSTLNQLDLYSAILLVHIGCSLFLKLHVQLLKLLEPEMKPALLVDHSTQLLDHLVCKTLISMMTCPFESFFTNEIYCSYLNSVDLFLRDIIHTRSAIWGRLLMLTFRRSYECSHHDDCNDNKASSQYCSHSAVFNASASCVISSTLKFWRKLQANQLAMDTLCTSRLLPYLLFKSILAFFEFDRQCNLRRIDIWANKSQYDQSCLLMLQFELQKSTFLEQIKFTTPSVTIQRYDNTDDYDVFLNDEEYSQVLLNHFTYSLIDTMHSEIHNQISEVPHQSRHSSCLFKYGCSILPLCIYSIVRLELLPFIIKSFIRHATHSNTIISSLLILTRMVLFELSDKESIVTIYCKYEKQSTALMTSLLLDFISQTLPLVFTLRNYQQIAFCLPLSSSDLKKSLVSPFYQSRSKSVKEFDEKKSDGMIKDFQQVLQHTYLLMLIRLLKYCLLNISINSTIRSKPELVLISGKGRQGINLDSFKCELFPPWFDVFHRLVQELYVIFEESLPEYPIPSSYPSTFACKRFIKFMSNQDDTLVDSLLDLFEVIILLRSHRIDEHNAPSSWSIVFIPSNTNLPGIWEYLFDVHLFFYSFLEHIYFDHFLMADFLISGETNFILLLNRYLKYLVSGFYSAFKSLGNIPCCQKLIGQNPIASVMHEELDPPEWGEKNSPTHYAFDHLMITLLKLSYFLQKASQHCSFSLKPILSRLNQIEIIHEQFTSNKS